MSLASEVNNLAIDNLVESSLESKNEDLRLKWISCSDITNMEPTPTNASRKHELKGTMHLLLGSSEECTPAFVSEFARIHSLPTHKYNNVDNNFKRYSEWLSRRNEFINGFTKYEDKFYMVADKLFYHCYS